MSLALKARRNPARLPVQMTATERRAARIVRDAVRALEAGASWSDVARGLNAASLSQAVNGLAWNDFERVLSQIEAPIAQEITEGGALIASQAGAGGRTGAAFTLPNAAGLGYSFNKTDPRIVGWAQAQSGKLVTSVTESTRAAIRQTIVDAFARQITVKDTAVRLRSVIGLTPKGAAAVTRLQDRVTEEYLRSGLTQTVATERAASQAARYAERLLNARAEAIARTEIMRASNEGRYLGWQQAVEGGWADRDSVKEWTTGGGACTICSFTSGERVRWDEQFSVGVTMPPAHSHCRCTAVLLPPNAAIRPVNPSEVPGVTPFETPAPPSVGVPSVPKAPQPPKSSYVPKPDRGKDFDKDMPKLVGQHREYLESKPKGRGAFNTEGVQNAANYYGYHAKPTLVTKDQMDYLIEKEGYTEIWRGVTGKGELSATEVANAFRTSETHWIGHGIYGHGTYTATVPKTAYEYAAEALGRKTPATGAVTSGYVTRMGLRPDARVADIVDLKFDFADFQLKFLGREEVEFAMDDISSYAMVRGYDAIRITDKYTKQGDFLLILNRSALAVERG